MREQGGGHVAILPEAAEELAAALQRAGQDAEDLLVRVRRALAEGGAAAPAAVQALDDAGEWGGVAAADLRWRIEAMLGLDRAYRTSGGMVAGLLPFTSRQAQERAVRQAREGLDRSLADPAVRGDATARAGAVARWAAGLGPGVLDAVAERAPGLLGNLDGIPPPVRYELNRRRIEGELDRVDSRLAGPLDPDRRTELVQRRAALAALAAPAHGRDRQLLAFDPSGDGLAAEVFGDLTGADHVAVLVPGMGSDLGSFPGLAGDALDLQLRARSIAPSGQQVATVAWLGYDAPDGELQAAQTDSARQGAPQLVDFLAGQGLAGDVHTTVVGHSDGGVVTGHALAAGLCVDDAVVFGSPGVGQGVTADDLRPEGGELYAMRTADDPIRYVDGHGGDPVNADFGAVVLAANPSAAGGYQAIVGHSAYYTPCSLSLGNVADTSKIGMLFLDLETPNRLRVEATATVSDDDAEMARYPGANLVARATVQKVFHNCGRYIHKHQRVTTSPYVPDEQGAVPYPSWKRIDMVQDVLRPGDAGRTEAEGGVITFEDYIDKLQSGKS